MFTFPVNGQRCFEMGKLILWLTAAGLPWYPAYPEQSPSSSCPEQQHECFWKALWQLSLPAAKEQLWFLMLWLPKQWFQTALLDLPCSHFYPGQREVIFVVADQWISWGWCTKRKKMSWLVWTPLFKLCKQTSCPMLRDGWGILPEHHPSAAVSATIKGLS